MDKETVESRLYAHYSSLRRMRYLEANLFEITRKLNVINEKISKCDYTLSDTLSGISYEGVGVQTSKISNPTEEELMKVHEELSSKKILLESERESVEDEMKALKGETEILTQVIEDIPEEFADVVLKEIYGYGRDREKSLREIGEIIRYSHGTVATIRDKSIEWLGPIMSPLDNH
jgi:hypothetical protein